MYQKAYGIIETLAPLHVGASAGEETGNLNLIFRDQFTLTGIIPGSSIRGRFRADMRDRDADKANLWYGQEAVEIETNGEENKTNEPPAKKRKETTEALVKFEYASLVWLPVFCPGQPVVWVTCPRLLKRYQAIAGTPTKVDLQKIKPYTASQNLPAREVEKNIDGKKKKVKVLFFNLGFLDLMHSADLSPWIPPGVDLPEENLVIVGDNDIAMIHDMALYRQSRTKLQNDMKKVENFFGVEALPEGSVLAFPIGLKQSGWQSELEDWEPSEKLLAKDLYFGGLESIGFGRCQVTLVGEQSK